MMLLLLAALNAHAADAKDLALAMEIPDADLLSATVSGNSLAYGTRANLGIITPHKGPDMAGLSSGRLGATRNDPGTDFGNNGTPSGDLSALTVSMLVPPNTRSMGFDFYFLSVEYPEWVGSEFNDTFTAAITGTAYSGNSAIDSAGNQISVNSVLFAITSNSQLTGTGFGSGQGGGTGWLTNLIPVDEGSIVSITFTVQDLGDGILDSTAMLDNFFWSEEDIDEPIILDPVRLRFLSPKRGPIAGFQPSLIYGANFNAGCLAYFDDTQVATTFVDPDTIEVLPPPHEVGLIDVEVRCDLNLGDTLYGGYTYYDTDSGKLPPVIETVDPYMVAVEGGEEVTVFGEGFEPNAKVRLDIELLDVTFVDENTLVFTTPPASTGLKALSVVNPNGLTDVREGALLYVQWDEWQGDDRQLSELGPGCKCATSGGARGWAPLLLLGLVGLRRRR